MEKKMRQAHYSETTTLIDTKQVGEGSQPNPNGEKIGLEEAITRESWKLGRVDDRGRIAEEESNQNESSKSRKGESRKRIHQVGIEAQLDSHEIDKAWGEITYKEIIKGGGEKKQTLEDRGKSREVGKRNSEEGQGSIGQLQDEEKERLYDTNSKEIEGGEGRDIGRMVRGYRAGEKDNTRTEDSDSTSSTIEALFRDINLEGSQGDGIELVDRLEYRNRAESVATSIDLIDAQQLEDFMQRYIDRKDADLEKVEEDRDSSDREGQSFNHRRGRQRNTEQLEEEERDRKDDSNSEEIERREETSIGLTRGFRIEEQERKGTRDSYSTSSSIAALFTDEHLEREGRKVGRNRITRRKVWMRWKGVIRGEIRRNIRKKDRIDRNEERQKEDKKLIFDYTTKGLSIDEISLLERGEGFCVTDYKIDEDRSKVDIDQFQRRLRLHELFRDPGGRENVEGEGVSTPRNRINRVDRMGVGNTQEIGGVGGNVSNSISRRSRNSTVGRGLNSVSRRLSSRTNNQGIQGATIIERRAAIVQREEADSSNTIRETEGGRMERMRRDGVENRQGVRIQRRESVRVPDREGSRASIVGSSRRSNIQSRGGEVRTGVQNSIRRSTSRTLTGRGRNSVRGRIVSQVTQYTTETRVEVVNREGIDSVSRTGVRRNNGMENRDTQEERTDIGNRQIGERLEGGGRRLPSIFDPDSQNRNLNRYNTCIQEEIMLALEDRKEKFRDNISKQERAALKLLKQRIEQKEIIITRADKGSGLVALDYDKYILKGTKYIEEEAGAYSRVTEREQDIIGKLTKERNKIAEQLKERGVITQQTATYIRKQLEEKITGIKFYYKIHKDRKIDTMPLRPLQSCIKAPMQHLSIVLTDILQPLLIDKNIPSFIFDSNQLLFRLQKLGKIPRNCTLISSDVSALYPSIPHIEGFRAMKNFLKEFTSFNSQQLESIMSALELVITENFMTWNSHIYKQSSGVAMGTPVAVAYANIFMHWVDREVRKKATYIHEHIRYIDDNLFILPEDKVEELMGVANNILPPHIKFTYEKLEGGTEKGLPFLDTQLFIGADYSIESRLYTKATDRHAYLLPSSYHPPHVTKNIPLAVFGRLRKICSREEWFIEDAQKAVGWLENRGYKKRDIQVALEKTRCKERWEMIEKIEKNRDKRVENTEGVEIDIPLILTYNQYVGKIRRVLKDRQPLLNSAFRRTKVRPRLSFRRRRNLNDIVVQKGLRGPIEVHNIEGNIFKKCGESPGYRSRCPCKGRHSQDLCRCCVHSREVIEGIEYKLSKQVSCNTKNIIYVIGCNKCSKKYVGETQQRLKDRLAQHMYNVAKLNQPLYVHFRQEHKLDNMYIGIVEAVRGVEPFMRKVREAWWINKLKTLEPSGFNVKLECNQVYEETG